MVNAGKSGLSDSAGVKASLPHYLDRWPPSISLNTCGESEPRAGVQEEKPAGLGILLGLPWAG